MSQFKALYGTRWQKARASFLRSHPLCAEHQRRGHIVPATVVDHIVPHRGDRALFWEHGNWQALCETCHNSWKQRVEKGGGVDGACDLNGVPTDPRHHWAARAGVGGSNR